MIKIQQTNLDDRQVMEKEIFDHWHITIFTLHFTLDLVFHSNLDKFPFY